MMRIKQHNLHRHLHLIANILKYYGINIKLYHLPSPYIHDQIMIHKYINIFYPINIQYHIFVQRFINYPIYRALFNYRNNNAVVIHDIQPNKKPVFHRHGSYIFITQSYNSIQEYERTYQKNLISYNN